MDSDREHTCGVSMNTAMGFAKAISKPKNIVLILASHYFGTLSDGRDLFAFTHEELLEIRKEANE